MLYWYWISWKLVIPPLLSSSSEIHALCVAVLPKFEVVINVPNVIHYEDTLWGSVTAKWEPEFQSSFITFIAMLLCIFKKKNCVFILRYTYGKPVQGQMNITYLHHFHGIEDAYDEYSEVCIFILLEADWWSVYTMNIY